MRLPFPDRFETRYVILFLAALFLAQQIEGTGILFSILSIVYVALFALAFNIAGGITYPSGAYIFFNGILAVTLGLVYKCILGEPGDSNLHNPIKTMSAFCVGMAGMAVAAFFCTNLRPRRALLEGFIRGEALKRAAIGCLLLGVIFSLAIDFASYSSGSISSALGQLNHFFQMAIILGTTYQIIHSEGKQSINWIVWSAGAWIFAIGLIGYSKEGIFAAPLAWLLPTLTLRFRFSKTQVLSLLLVGIFTIYYLVPYSQYGRRNRGLQNRSEAVGALLPLLLHLQTTRELYLGELEAVEKHNAPQYYNTDQGLMEREEMLGYDDAIIAYTDQGNVFGLLPTYASFLNIVPHFLWANKPISTATNDYGHELGVLSTDDSTTHISFSPTGDAYHEAQWFGVIIVLPIVMFFTFFATDTLTGSARNAPWALLLIAVFAHVAPEGLLEGAIYTAIYGNIAIIFVALLARYILPYATNLVLGPVRQTVQRTLNFTPQPAPVRTRSLPMHIPPPPSPSNPESPA